MELTAILGSYLTRRGYFVRLETRERRVVRESPCFATIAEAKAAYPHITGWRDPGADAELDVIAIAAVGA
ncbi:MAG: hypothetical protein HY329_12475 [Chloroflexi bacterium]|nr:hypothetical protein [Chloroflexota bacterium]